MTARSSTWTASTARSLRSSYVPSRTPALDFPPHCSLCRAPCPGSALIRPHACTQPQRARLDMARYGRHDMADVMAHVTAARLPLPAAPDPVNGRGQVVLGAFVVADVISALLTGRSVLPLPIGLASFPSPPPLFFSLRLSVCSVPVGRVPNLSPSTLLSVAQLARVNGHACALRKREHVRFVSAGTRTRPKQQTSHAAARDAAAGKNPSRARALEHSPLNAPL